MCLSLKTANEKSKLEGEWKDDRDRKKRKAEEEEKGSGCRGARAAREGSLIRGLGEGSGDESCGFI